LPSELELRVGNGHERKWEVPPFQPALFDRNPSWEAEACLLLWFQRLGLGFQWQMRCEERLVSTQEEPEPKESWKSSKTIIPIQGSLHQLTQGPPEPFLEKRNKGKGALARRLLIAVN
jgi:hypothetical protein